MAKEAHWPAGQAWRSLAAWSPAVRRQGVVRGGLGMICREAGCGGHVSPTIHPPAPNTITLKMPSDGEPRHQSGIDYLEQDSSTCFGTESAIWISSAPRPASGIRSQTTWNSAAGGECCLKASMVKTISLLGCTARITSGHSTPLCNSCSTGRGPSRACLWIPFRGCYKA